MTAPLTGYTATLPADVVLDSGQLYVGATVFGAFNGGLKFDPGVEYRNIEFDGKRSPITALDRKTALMSTTNVLQIEPGATVVAGGAWTGSTSYMPKDAAGFLAAGDYLTDVRCVWLRGGGNFVQVRFPSALCTKYDITSQDGAEIAIAITIEARLDMGVTGAQIGDAPYRIEYIASV